MPRAVRFLSHHQLSADLVHSEHCVRSQIVCEDMAVFRGAVSAPDVIPHPDALGSLSNNHKTSLGMMISACMALYSA